MSRLEHREFHSHENKRGKIRGCLMSKLHVFQGTNSVTFHLGQRNNVLDLSERKKIL